MTDAEYESIKRTREEIGRLRSFRHSMEKGYIDIIASDGMPLRVEKGALMYRCVMDMLDRDIRELEKTFYEE